MICKYCFHLFLMVFFEAQVFYFDQVQDIYFFLLFAVANNAAKNIGVHVSFQMSVFVFFRKIEEKFLARVEVLFLNF